MIRFQTTAHTLSLILGLLGTASDHMKRYLDSKGLGARLDDDLPARRGGRPPRRRDPGLRLERQGSPIQSTRETGAFHVRSDRVSNAGIAFVSTRPDGVNLSGGLLSLRYRSAAPIDQAIIALKPAGGPTVVAGLIPTEIFSHFADTGGREEEIQVPLPATPGLAQIKEVVITFGPEAKGRPIDLSITRLRVAPIAPAEHERGQGP